MRASPHLLQLSSCTQQVDNLGLWHSTCRLHSPKANGNDPKVAQELLRHAKLATTMDGYTQALSPDKRRAHRGVIRLVVPRQVPRKLVAALSD